MVLRVWYVSLCGLKLMLVLVLLSSFVCIGNMVISSMVKVAEWHLLGKSC